MNDEPPGFTLDTNVLVYAADGRAGRRQVLASGLVRRAAACGCRLTLQAISELYAAVTRKKLLSHQDAGKQAAGLLTLFLDPMPPSAT